MFFSGLIFVINGKFDESTSRKIFISLKKQVEIKEGFPGLEWVVEK